MAVINESLARRLWPDASPLGRAFRADRPDAGSIVVIGVVANHTDETAGHRAQPAFFRSFPHEYASRMSVLMRVEGDPRRYFAPLRQTITNVNRDLAVMDVRTVDDLLEDLSHQRRVPATALTAIGFFGLLLSAVGLYGVVAYGVRERSRELGIRLALGARPAGVRWLVVREGFAIIGAGGAIGAAATIALTQVMRSRLFGVRTLDPPTLVTVGAVLIAVGFGALYLPARWASAIEPAETLRAE